MVFIMVSKFAKVSSLSFALMLIISIFAFAYVIGSETKMVNAAAVESAVVWVDPFTNIMYTQQDGGEMWRSPDGQTTNTGQIEATNRGWHNQQAQSASTAPATPAPTAATSTADTTTDHGTLGWRWIYQGPVVAAKAVATGTVDAYKATDRTLGGILPGDSLSNKGNPTTILEIPKEEVLRDASVNDDDIPADYDFTPPTVEEGSRMEGDLVYIVYADGRVLNIETGKVYFDGKSMNNGDDPLFTEPYTKEEIYNAIQSADKNIASEATADNTPYPSDGATYGWDKETLSWVRADTGSGADDKQASSNPTPGSQKIPVTKKGADRGFVSASGLAVTDTKSTYTFNGKEEITAKGDDENPLTIKPGDEFTVTENVGTEKKSYIITDTKTGRTYTTTDISKYNGVMQQSKLSVIAKHPELEGASLTTYKGTEFKDGVYSSMKTGGVYNAAGDRIGTDRGEVKTIFGPQNFGIGQLVQGLQWASVSAGLIQTIGGLFIKDKDELSAATAGIAAGILVGKGLYGLLGKGGVGGITNRNGANWIGSPWTSGAIGVATAWLVYNAMWKKEKVTTETVTFKCLSWEAPHGGADCELCNDATLPCSEYRCRSLGQSCAIVNKGTKEERCVNVNPRDVSPPIIKPQTGVITDGYEYFDIKEMPPGAGFKVGSKTASNKCIPAYTTIQFGITTDEPSQCKIDIEPKGNYSKMTSYLNGDNLYQYNHSEYLNLPSSADIKNSSIALKNGKELTFYIRCRDAAGNSNEADYAMTLCVDPSPDNTAPVVHGTSIKNKGCVAASTENATVEF